MELTEKQKIFCNEYLIDLNATRAYKAAYPNCKKDETARVNGSKLLTKTNIKDYVQERMKERENRTEITQDKVINELAKIAFSNGTDFAKVVEKSCMEPVYDEDGVKIGEEEVVFKDVEIIPTEQLSEDKKKAISNIKRTKFGIEVASCDKVKALELLGKHLGIFVDKVEAKVDGNQELNVNIKVIE